MFKTLTHLYGNKTGQRFLERIVRKSLLYMGVGSGENVHESGEAGVLHKLKALEASPYCIFDVDAHQGQNQQGREERMPICHSDWRLRLRSNSSRRADR